MKTLTLRQIIQAIQNPLLPKATGEFFSHRYFKNEQGVMVSYIVAADAIGNASIALSVDPSELYEVLVDDAHYSGPVSIVGDIISEWNDNIDDEYTLETIADMAFKKYANDLDSNIYMLRDWIAYIKTEHGYKKQLNVNQA